ncbi:MAG TPA: hypothetical protein VGQ09_12770 [Chitinophagaceae bacterium]|jgi:hypothetical protein|nr:hypothetical protein [Chitinophagaceae bacterium]
MEFIFPATVIWNGKKYQYKVYKFKLTPNQYKAELIYSTDKYPITEITFTKDKGGWKTPLKSKIAQHLVEVLGNDIEHWEN